MNTILCNAIRNGDFDIALPLSLTLMDGRSMQCQQLLRLLPGKRAVFIAAFNQRTVLAKVFLSSAQRQVERERLGFSLLRKAQQPTPDLMLDAAFDGGTVLVYEFLPSATALFREDIAPDDATLGRLFDRLQAMYAAGIYQHDLHWGNFLLYGNTAIVIDTGAIAGDAAEPLSSQVVTDNLGLLVAQFRRSDQQAVYDELVKHPITTDFALDPHAVWKAVQSHWQSRKKTLLEKCFRTTTDIFFKQRFDCAYAYRRQYVGVDLQRFLCQPDAVMAEGKPLKLGNSATVVKTIFDGRPVVIKRYNIKSFTHWLRRCPRPSRAWTSWRNARWLELLGLDTPAPIAMMEMRFGPLRRHAYYVCEYAEGDELLSALQQRQPNERELAAIESYFCIAASDHLIHGDMKATNFFLSDSKLIILDLDAMREVKNTRRWRKLFLKDYARFTRNWSEDAQWPPSLRNIVEKLTP